MEKKYHVEYWKDGQIVKEGPFTSEEAFAVWSERLSSPGHINPSITRMDIKPMFVQIVPKKQPDTYVLLRPTCSVCKRQQPPLPAHYPFISPDLGGGWRSRSWVCKHVDVRCEQCASKPAGCVVCGQAEEYT